MSEELKAELRQKLKDAGVRTDKNTSLEKLQELVAELDKPSAGENVEAVDEIISPKRQPLYLINIAPTGEDYNPVYLHVGGNDYILPRDKDTIVPKGVKDLLSDMREPRIVFETGANGEMVQINRNVQRYQFTCEMFEGELPQ